MDKKLTIIFIFLWTPKVLSIKQNNIMLPHTQSYENAENILLHAKGLESRISARTSGLYRSSKKTKLYWFLHTINQDIIKRLDWRKTFYYYQIFINQSTPIKAIRLHELLLSIRSKLLYSIRYITTTLFPNDSSIQQRNTDDNKPSQNSIVVEKKRPIISYLYSQIDPFTKESVLKKELSWKLSHFSATIENVNKYFVSPGHKYLLIQRDIYNTVRNRTIGRLIPQLYTPELAFELFNIESPQKIASFPGTIVTHMFSPQETILLIAGSNLGGTVNLIKGIFGLNKPSKKGALASLPGTIPLRSVKATNEIFQHKLFDIASRTFIQTFENIQALHFMDENYLFAAYDNGETECVAIIRNKTPYVVRTVISWLYKQLSIKIPQKTLPAAYLKTMFDHAHATLQVKLPHYPEQSFIHTHAYELSPNKRFLLIHTKPSGICNQIKNIFVYEQSLTTVLNVHSGNIITTIPNIINYRFNHNETELHALISDTSWISKSTTGTQHTIITTHPETSEHLANLNAQHIAEISEKEKYKNQMLYDELPDTLKAYVPRENILYSDNDFFDSLELDNDEFYYIHK